MPKNLYYFKSRSVYLFQTGLRAVSHIKGHNSKTGVRGANHDSLLQNERFSCRGLISKLGFNVQSKIFQCLKWKFV